MFDINPFIIKTDIGISTPFVIMTFKAPLFDELIKLLKVVFRVEFFYDVKF